MLESYIARENFLYIHDAKNYDKKRKTVRFGGHQID